MNEVFVILGKTYHRARTKMLTTDSPEFGNGQEIFYIHSFYGLVYNNHYFLDQQTGGERERSLILAYSNHRGATWALLRRIPLQSLHEVGRLSKRLWA